ncbi:MAG: primosomal protein N' [Chloroflexi bacterium]|nr:primosomal protein N' [Chloroflexota bacterium]
MNDAGRAVRVAVEAIADRPERTFSYLLPDALGPAAPGALLLVPYGPRLALGYLLDGPAEPSAAALREVEAVVSEPMLTPDLLDLAVELATYYRAPLGTTIAAMLPPGLESRVARRWFVADPERLPPELDGMADGEGAISDATLRQRGPRRGGAAWIERLRRAGVLRAVWQLRPPDVAARRVRTVRATTSGPFAPPRGPIQRAMMAVLGADTRTLASLASEVGVEPARLLGPARRLEAAGLVELGWQAVERDPLAHREALDAPEHGLAGEQREALDAIMALPPGGELLLQGVAASGKTDVYLGAVRATLASGRGAIVLVPEVTLIPQLADRLRAVVGERLAVLHSALSAGERHDEWWRILRGDARVVVGTRTAAFAPLDAGLIVIDEEHDGAYKSDRTPRYDARWVARGRAVALGARLVLGSATPDLVTIARVRGGYAESARLLQRRVGGTPEIEVVDMRAELAGGNRSMFSAPLASALDGLERGAEQAVLVINRRGAATFILCRDCGESLRCPDCDLPYVYHLDGRTLRCHHCGRTSTPPETCPTCGSARIRYFGAGTQRVESELRARWPALRVARLDSDAVSARRGFESVYDDFRAGRVDVLVGTQLAAKGLDLPSVTVAAVVAADVTLNLPDYRAAERTFALLAQVAGRAGRGPRPGRVLIQTYAPGHHAVRTAAMLDVDGFADEELLRRRLLGYPPFSLLARLMIADSDRDRALERAERAAAASAIPGVEVLGPQPSYVPRRAGRYRFQVVLRSPAVEARMAALERVPPGVAIDVDPESLL